MADLESLRQLIVGQFEAVAFENVTSLLRRVETGPEGPVPPIDVAQLRANWASGQGGGVCYEIATVFYHQLLSEGYDVRQVLAQISFPDGHQAAVATMNGREYLVDVGTGSPVFLPVPLDEETAIVAAGLQFRFRPDPEPGFFLQERLIDGEWKTSTRYDLAIQSEERRMAAYQLHHTYGKSWVVDRLRMIKWVGDETCYSITGNALTTTTAYGKDVRTLGSIEEVEHVAREIFGVPHLPIRDAVAARPEFIAG